MNDLPESAVSRGPELESLDYLRGVKSSTCLLLPTTPSPTPLDLDFKHPLSEDVEAPFLTLNDESNLVALQNPECNGDSSSSGDSNSVVQDPVSAQLINNISMLDYQTLSKNGDLILGQVEDCKLNGNLSSSTNKKLPSFVNWNWVIIRKVLLWVVVSGLIACLAAIIGMVVAIPKECNPDLPWHQGKVFYEIFPAAFKDSSKDGTGDLKGIIKKLDYIHDLGASAIRLNSIFKASHYPEQYFDVTSLTDIDPSIGTINDFQNLVSAIHHKGMHIILDLPVVSMVDYITASNLNRTQIKYLDKTSEAIEFWVRTQMVDGFYLKQLEKFVDEYKFGKSLQLWKQILGVDRIFLASEEAYNKARNSAGNSLNVLLSRIDLIDFNLDLKKSITGLKNRLNEILNGVLWSKPNYPWVHWNIGNIDSERIASSNVNNTLALTALEFILPGTVSMFYGDEIGLANPPTNSIETDFEHDHTLNLVQMSFSNDNNNEQSVVLPWNSKSNLEPNYQFLEVIKSFIQFRLNTPTIYLHAIYKEGNIFKNIEIRNTEEDLVVIERWYPRRNSCVFVGNLGSVPITTDLSSMFYGGTVIAGTNTSLVGQVIYMDQVTFPPNSAIILKLQK